ncbi:Uma2 family endonuclease [Streptomyces niveiscabiei]|uniref:Uma2 family endonuclease n=1 Tax=Streptomyces niveiscabiei TaxID=164115 RepID=UPI0029B5B2C1|nr:Uma2 family endonuclease [Streptomyces niveiscabiei]MDX3385089.1 Uma2 family endonuclease [Streptomyces niveiscabiei]
MTPTESPQLSPEDFAKLVAAAPEHIRLVLVDGRMHAEGPLSVEDFEELARKSPEGVRLELIDGKLKVKPLPDQRHRAIVLWLLQLFLKMRPDLLLYPEQGLRVDAYRKGHAYADAALAPHDHFIAYDGDWADPDGVLLVVEVTSHDRDTHQRDRVDKVRGYAAAGIPVYLLIDRDDNTLVVYSNPESGLYRHSLSYPWGTTVPLPPPVGVTLDTDRLKDYAD